MDSLSTWFVLCFLFVGPDTVQQKAPSAKGTWKKIWWRKPPGARRTKETQVGAETSWRKPHQAKASQSKGVL
jgi:hypothetical protein